MRKFLQQNLRLILSVAILAIPILYVTLVLDIGINSKYFIKRDFNRAFLARKTGNCELFKSYIHNEKDKWGERCVNEKDGKSIPIAEFSIKEVTVNGKDAFTQVQLLRDISPSIKIKLTEAQIEAVKEGYLVNYDLTRDNSDKFLWVLPKSRWVIKNEIRE